jgi:hypothetical protein
MLKIAFGEQTARRTQACEWFSKFKSGVTSVEGTKHSGCPSTSNTDENMDLMKNLYSKTDTIKRLVMKLLTCREFH